MGFLVVNAFPNSLLSSSRTHDPLKRYGTTTYSVRLCSCNVCDEGHCVLRLIPGTVCRLTKFKGHVVKGEFVVELFRHLTFIERGVFIEQCSQEISVDFNEECHYSSPAIASSWTMIGTYGTRRNGRGSLATKQEMGLKCNHHRAVNKFIVELFSHADIS